MTRHQKLVYAYFIESIPETYELNNPGFSRGLNIP